MKDTLIFTKRMVALLAILAATAVFAQVGIDRVVNAYSLVTNTWSAFTVTTLNASSVSIGSGTSFTGIASTNVSLDFASCNTNATVTLTQTISGIDTNDVAVVNIVSPHTSFVYNCSVTAADTVTIRASNISITNAINQAATDARITVIKY